MATQKVAKTPDTPVESQVYGSGGSGKDVDMKKGVTPESTLKDGGKLPPSIKSTTSKVPSSQ